MQDHVTTTNPDSFKATLTWKLPAYIIGVLFGFLVVQIAMAWFGGA